MANNKKDIEEKFNSVFAKRLREIMKEKGITQYELSKEIGITRQAISNYTLGQTLPNIDVLYKISNQLQVSANYLIGLSDVPSLDVNKQFICDNSGLSEKAFEKLKEITVPNIKEPNSLDSLDALERRKIFHSFLEQGFLAGIIQSINDYNSAMSYTMNNRITYIDYMNRKIDAIYSGKEISLDPDEFELNKIGDCSMDVKYSYLEIQDILFSFVKEYCKETRNKYVIEEKKCIDDLQKLKELWENKKETN